MDSEIYQLIEALKARAEKIGLYMEQVAVASPTAAADPEIAAKIEAEASLKEMLDSGEVSLVMFATFRPGDVAFSERVINEAKYRADEEFGSIAPTSKEMKYDRIVDRLAATDDDDPLAFLDEEL